MKMKNLALLVAMLALVLGIGGSALAQVMGEHHAQQPAAQQQQAQQPAAQQQQAQQPSTQQQQAQQPSTQQQQAQEPPAQQPQAPPAQQAQEPPAQQPQAPPAQQPQAPEPPVELSCADIYRAEQAELAAGSGYPTSVSDEARACDDSGEANPYPAPIFYDDEGFLYVYDPVADRYTAPDPATGLLHFYDIVTDSYSTYDPETGEYL
jgi:outer membrane biosynthesis protein TonB